ncbi:TPA: hypothetical protein QCU33_005353 [Bacillus cereus]|nr:hypothetical protein [Bacillus cereus]
MAYSNVIFNNGGEYRNECRWVKCYHENIYSQSSTTSNFIGISQSACSGTINLLVGDTVIVRFDGVQNGDLIAQSNFSGSLLP